MNSPEDCNRILIATRDKNVEAFLLKELTRYDIFMNCYDQGSSTLLAIMEEDFELAIIDDDLIGLNGHKIIPLIRKIRPKLPIVHLYFNGPTNNSDSIDVGLRINKPLNDYKLAAITKKLTACMYGYGLRNNSSLN